MRGWLILLLLYEGAIVVVILLVFGLKELSSIEVVRVCLTTLRGWVRGANPESSAIKCKSFIYN